MTRATPSNTDDDKPVVLPAADVYYWSRLAATETIARRAGIRRPMCRAINRADQ